jgi:hypothetical protein
MAYEAPLFWKGINVKLFWRLCICGLLGSLLLWVFPKSLKIYHFDRWDNDWKILFVEQTREYGFAANGIVYGHHVMAYDSHELSNSGKELDPIRDVWHKTGFSSRRPWPLNSNRVTYDEWGPSNWRLPNGIKVTQVGAIFCIPYSVIAIVCGLPLLLREIYRWRRRKDLETGPITEPEKVVIG